MIDNIFEIATLLFIPAVLFVIYLIMPRLTRREIVFGVRIPDDQIDNADLKGIYRKYTKTYLLVCLPVLVILSVLVLTAHNQWIMIAGLLLYTLISYSIYYHYHKETARLKRNNNWDKGKKEVVVVDTGLLGHKKAKILVSPLWFLIPLGIIVFNVIATFYKYNGIPGETVKLLLTQAIVTIIMFFAYKTIGYAKQQIKSSDPEKSIYRNKKYRQAWSGFIIFIAVTVNIIYTLHNFGNLELISIQGDTIALIGFVTTAVTLVTAILLAVRTGQGGSRIRIREKNNKATDSIDRNDDRHWKFGLFYFNPNDPSIFVEKRYGIGMTVNFGRVEGLLVLGGIIAAIILLTIFN